MKNAAQGITGLLLVVMLALSPIRAIAQTPPPDQPTPVPYERLADLVPWPAGDLPGGRGPFSRGLDGASDPVVSVIVQFEGSALAERVVERGRMTAFDQRSYTATLRSRQAEVVHRVQQAGGAVIGQFTKAYNGVQVQVRASELKALREASGVQAIYPVRTHYPALDHSTELINADAVWALGETGYTGEGVTIAVIDTGLDYTHAAFGGPGTVTAYSSNNPNIVEPDSFPTEKVVGGYDFAGTAYHSGSDNPLQTIPYPDPDPLDENYHGTHVASIAAGDTTSGYPYSGVAPAAEIYAVKIFGRNGSTELVMNALEWCMDPDQDATIDDRIDIINLSLGSPYGVMEPNPEHPENVVMQTLTNLGIVIVAAAGNEHNEAYITGSPAVADSAISVAASTSAGEPDDQIADFSSRGPRGYDSALKPEISAPGTSILAAAIGTGIDSIYLSGTSMASPYVAGVAALVRQAHPEWTPEKIKAAMMNTAFDFGEEIPRMGAGRVDALRAVTTTTVAVGDPKLVSLSWGVIEFNETNYTTTRPVAVHNSSDGPKTYAISTVWGSGSNQAGASFTTESEVTVPADGVASFNVALHLSADQIVSGPGLDEYYGFVRLQNQSDASDVLVVPFYFLPAPYTTISVDSFGFDATSASGIFDHQGPIASELSAHTAYVYDANDPTIRDNADLRLVTVDYSPSLPGEGWVVFGFNLYDAFHNPQFFFVEIDLYLDINQDSIEDYVIFNYDGGRWNDGKTIGQFNNQWTLLIVNLHTLTIEEIEAGELITDFNSGTMFWQLPASLFGSEDSKFDFSAVSFDFDYSIDRESDITPLRSVDYLEQTLSVDLETYAPHGDQDITISVTRQADSYNRPLGVALFDSRGRAGEGQATFLPFDSEFYTLSYDAFPTGGQIIGHPAGMYLPGSQLTLMATPRGDYFFVKWIVNGVEHTANSIGIQLDSDYTVQAVFEPLEKTYLPLILR